MNLKGSVYFTVVTGFVLGYVGLLSVITQAVIVGKLSERFRDDNLIFVCVGIMALSLLAWAYAPSMLMLLIVLVPIAFSGGVLNTVISSALTKAVQPQDIGGILGLAASIESLTRVIAPTMGGVMLENLGVWSPGVISAIILSGLFVYVWFVILNNPVVKHAKVI